VGKANKNSRWRELLWESQNSGVTMWWEGGAVNGRSGNERTVKSQKVKRGSKGRKIG